MNVLFPGRHHLLTDYQFKYLNNIIRLPLNSLCDVDGKNLPEGKIDAIIFAVTSSNHSNTRRNPLPFYQRVIGLTDFSSDFHVPFYIYGIDDVGYIEDFAEYTIKRLYHESNGVFNLHPSNTVVLCSTPVLEMYQKLGFRILPCELENKKSWKYKTSLPWEIVEHIASNDYLSIDDELIFENMHISSQVLWERYGLFDKVKTLFKDTMIGDDGDITETRDYNTYVRQMDEIAEIKFSETAGYIRCGRIGDIGCAVGSWIKQASNVPLYQESDFYGIEVARHLYNICIQRKENGDFKNPYVFFSQKNAVTGLVFDENSMNTIHTSSLTHEIESYGGRKDLFDFICNRYKELAPGGVWINRDVVAPENKDRIIYLWLNKEDGKNDECPQNIEKVKNIESYLAGLSTFSRFLQFANDFRKNEGYQLSFEKELINDIEYIKLSLKDAYEFLSKKDYVDNWKSEMHETFCFFSFDEWCNTAREKGFHIANGSKAYVNDWIVKNRFEGKAKIFVKDKEGVLILQPFDSTHMILVLEKRI